MREWGDDGAPFLFWHSLGPAASGATIAVAAEPLVDVGYRVIAPDARGFGKSPRRTSTPTTPTVVRPACRHQVLVDLGPRAGELAADWLRARDLA